MNDSKRDIDWTNPSVIHLQEEQPTLSPFAIIERKARELALEAMEKGWHGPPYDPFQLADLLEIELVARQDVEDARLLLFQGSPRIEFNPQRRPARVRFSVAHELGHFLFSDYGDRPRYRDLSERSDDDWQLEVLCNVAAAEFLMPAGALPIQEADQVSLPHLLNLRAKFGVSTEALLRRVIKLTNRPISMFAAARLPDSREFRIDYLVGSRAWSSHIAPGQVISSDGVLAHCTAVGFSESRVETWAGESLCVEAVGVPPYPGDRFPRLVGLLQPEAATQDADTLFRYLHGDAAEVRQDSRTIIAHVVNDRAGQWGGSGFAPHLARKYDYAREQYKDWATENLARGSVHLAEAGSSVWIASLVAQAGYGDEQSHRPRIRLAALRQCLETLAHMAEDLDAQVQMPLIGTGQGGADWSSIRDLVIEELVDRRIDTTVYLLPDHPIPDERPPIEQLSLI